MVFGPVPGKAGGSGLPLAPAVVITTTGSTFSPWVQVASPSVTVTWTWNGGSTTGLTPSINFGSSATRQVVMTASAPGRYSALDQVGMFNVGFSHIDDSGRYSLPAIYDWTPQAISGITGIPWMTGLQKFLAANISSLTGALDFSGLKQLTHIETFKSRVQQVNLAGCTGIVRICVEQNNLTTLDLNPVAPYAYELRAAFQAGGALTLVPFTQNLPNDYHFCFRDQVLTNMPPLTRLPVVEELWFWNTGQSGSLVPASSKMRNLAAHSNAWTSADLTNQFPGTLAGSGVLDLHQCRLTSVTLNGCSGIGIADLSQNPFSQGTVDGILGVFDGFGTSGGTLNLSNTALPSSTGNTHASNLTGRGWTVSVNPTTLSVLQTVQGAAFPLSFPNPVLSGSTVFIIAGFNAFPAGPVTTSSPTLGGSSVSGAAALFNPGTTGGVNSAASGTNHSTYYSVWMLPNVSAGATTVNLTVSGQGSGGFGGVTIMEVSGLGATPVLDKSSSGSNASSTAVDSGASGAITTSPELIIGGAQIFNGSAAAPGGWTTVFGGPAFWAAYQFAASSGGSYDWAQTASSSGEAWSAGVATIHA